MLEREASLRWRLEICMESAARPRSSYCSTRLQTSDSMISSVWRSMKVTAAHQIKPKTTVAEMANRATYHRASLKLKVLRTFGRITQHVSRAAHGVQQGFVEVLVYL